MNPLCLVSNCLGGISPVMLATYLPLQRLAKVPLLPILAFRDSSKAVQTYNGNDQNEIICEETFQ